METQFYGSYLVPLVIFINDHATRNLVAFNGFEQGLEITF
ncbi:MAG: hypothetical protein ACI935_002798, partial [Moritella dasanensis]